MGSRARALAFWALSVVLPVLGGAAIYLLWRPTTLRVFGWLGQLGMDAPVRGARQAAAPLGQALPDFVLYSLPDGLWALALSAAMARIWRGSLRGLGAWSWVGTGLIIGVGGEGLQLLGLLPGTADPVDAITSLVGAGAGIWLGLRPQVVSPPAADGEAPSSSLG